MSEVKIISSSRELTKIEKYVVMNGSPANIKDSGLMNTPLKVNFIAEVEVSPEKGDSFEEFRYVFISTNKGNVRTQSESVTASLDRIDNTIGLNEPDLGIVFSTRTSKKFANRKYIIAEPCIIESSVSAKKEEKHEGFVDIPFEN